jgi:transposase
VAKLVSKITLGIDVAKDQHIVFNWQTQEITTLSNQHSAIKDWLKSFPGPLQIAIEPTSHYHLQLIDEALAQGHEVYLIDQRQLVHYRQAINVRNKTDPLDAWLLARYLQHEGQMLRPYRPQAPRARRLWALILRRATVVQSRQQLQQSFRELSLSIKALLSEMSRLLLRIDQEMKRLIRELGWWNDYQRCCSIPGIGPGNAAALVTAYWRGAFSGSDAFVAYMGLDVRIRESGQFKGKRKLTKRGEAELRRLLFCASHAARTDQRFADYYQKQLAKGLSKIAARVALSRKLARIAFTLMQNKENFIKQEKFYCTAP